MEQFLEIAALDQEQILRIQELERQFGLQIMAYQRGRPTASLTDVQLQQLKELEEDLGVILLAFESEASAGTSST